VSALLVPLVLLAGCGGDDPASDDTGSSTVDGGSGDGDSGAGSPDEAPDVCALLPAEAASEVAGFTVTAEEGPFDVCEYNQEDPRATSFTLGALVGDDLGGGVETYLDGLSAALQVEDEATPDIGDGARVVTGTTSGFSQTAGAALSGGVLYTVNLTPGSDLDAAGELALAEKLLRAVVDAA